MCKKTHRDGRQASGSAGCCFWPLCATGLLTVLLLLAVPGLATADEDRDGEQGRAAKALAAVEGPPEGAIAPGSPPGLPEEATFGEPVFPVILASVPVPVAEKLRPAFDLAVQRVREVPECRALFANLGCDGPHILATTRYLPVNPLKEVSICQRGAVAFTFVGGAETWVCRRFTALSVERGAMIIVHEALHHCGLTETPMDPDAMTAREINNMVSRACGF